MLSKLLTEELRAAAAFTGNEGEVSLADGRTAFLVKGDNAEQRCTERFTQLPTTQIPLSGVIECAPGVYGFAL